MSEKCDRCGSIGEDRRTLWMACFYDMSELDVPFKEEELQQTYMDGEGVAHIQEKKMHTLRVCKRCRAEWMCAIEAWHKTTPQGEDCDADEPEESDIGSGIFVRENGVTKEITEEEWYKKNPGREPVRVVAE